MAMTANIDVHKPWSKHVLGLAFYRAGRYEKAIAKLEASQMQSDLNGQVKICNWLALAMSHHRLGHHAEAAAALENARSILVEERRNDSKRSSSRLLPRGRGAAP